MIRDSFLSLNGIWKLNGSDIDVPYCPESKASEYKGIIGNKLVYTKSFDIPDGFIDDYDKVILHFGAVDQVCDVYLNDKFLMNHEGGYLSFSVDITNCVHKNNNVLKLVCMDSLDPYYPTGKQCKKPHGMWYTPVSGIWQSVWLESYHKDGIDNISIKTDMNNVYIHIDSNADEFKIVVDGKEYITSDKDIAISIDNPHLWDIDDPYLYDLSIAANNDLVKSYFGLRKIEAKNNKLYLNNKPLFICGLLDQGYYEEGIYTPIDVKDYETDILNMKELGYNCLRKHIKVEPEAFYYYCDKHGMLVMQDMVNTGKYNIVIDTGLSFITNKFPKPIISKKRFDFFIKHSKDAINQLKSHPSIFAYTIYNEGWGQQGADKAYELLKPLDEDRLFDSTSGWFMEHKSDFSSYHVYFRNEVLNDPRKPLLLSECGGFIRKIEDHKSDVGSKWGYGETDSEESLTNKILEMYDKMVIPSIKNGLVGMIYTQVSDVEGEINGLYTYDRKICKVNKKILLEANNKLKQLYVDNI